MLRGPIACNEEIKFTVLYACTEQVCKQMLSLSHHRFIYHSALLLLMLLSL